VFSLIILTISDNESALKIEGLALKKIGLELIIINDIKKLDEIDGNKKIDCFFFYWEPSYSKVLLNLQAISENPNLNKIPIIILGLDFTEKDKNILSEFDIDLFIQQPIPQNQLIKQVKKLLERPTREEERVSAQPLGSFEFSGPDGKYTGKIKNLSLSGSLIETDKIIDNNNFLVDLKIFIKNINNPLQISAEIVRFESRAEGGSKVALRFIKFMKNSKMDLKTFLRKNNEDQRLDYYI